MTQNQNLTPTNFRLVDFMEIDLQTEDNYRDRLGYDDDLIRSLAESMQNEYTSSGGGRWMLQPVRLLKREESYGVHIGFRRMCAVEWLLYQGEAVYVDGVKQLPRHNLWARYVPAFIDDGEGVSIATQLVENLQRVDPSPVATALALVEMQGTGKGKKSTAELGELLGMSPSWVQQHLRLLKLPQEVIDALSDGSINTNHARALTRLTKAEDQLTYFNLTVKRGWDGTKLDEEVDKLFDRRRKESLEPSTQGALPGASEASTAQDDDGTYISTSTIDDADDGEPKSRKRAEVDTSSGETPVGQETQQVIPAGTLYVERKQVTVLAKKAATDAKLSRKQAAKAEEGEARDRVLLAVGFHTAIHALATHFAATNSFEGFDSDDILDAMDNA